MRNLLVIIIFVLCLSLSGCATATADGPGKSFFGHIRAMDNWIKENVW
ncbi:MAG: hypothetical protein WC552_06790 [Candidatus Omnitrophota bacterium]